jgi:CheY-like chemotaxis protein
MRVLIADDDAISLTFFASALQQMGCATASPAGLPQALALAAGSSCDLLLLDRNMPGGGGIELLAALRARGVVCPAIATSAELTAPIRAVLQAAGFAACLEKPVTLAHLHEFLRAWLEPGDIPALDDAGGLAAIGGDRNSLVALRAMLAQEVSALQDELASDSITPDALLARLHRLRASCGFCGAPKLAAAAIALERALRTDAGIVAAPREAFIACCAETVAALGT